MADIGFGECGISIEEMANVLITNHGFSGETAFHLAQLDRDMIIWVGAKVLNADEYVRFCQSLDCGLSVTQP